MVHNSPHLPPLDTLEAFVTAARTGSFTATAARLGVTHGAVSRQIGRLERWLGAPVFERQARGVSLNPDGWRFFARAEAALATLGGVENRWAPQRRAAVVRLSATPSFAGLWLFPRLTALEGGDLSVEIVVEHRLADFSDGLDLAVRCGRGPWEGVTSALLWRESLIPVASPGIVAGLASAFDPNDLMALPLLHDSTIAGWQAWLAAAGVAYVQRPSDRRFEDYNLVLEACAAGLGLALGRSGLVEPALESGRLVRLGERYAPNTVAFHLVRPESALRAPAAEFAARLLRMVDANDDTIADFTAPLRRRTKALGEG
jgi:DNA-binding transcriptional LysR family regulator